MIIAEFSNIGYKCYLQLSMKEIIQTLDYIDNYIWK